MRLLARVQGVVDEARAEIARMFHRAVGSHEAIRDLYERIGELTEKLESLEQEVDALPTKDDVNNTVGSLVEAAVDDAMRTLDVDQLVEKAVTEKFESQEFTQAVELVVKGMHIEASDLIDEDAMIDLVKQALRALAER